MRFGSTRLRNFAWGAAGAVTALLVVWLGVHLYIDHANLHALVTLVQQQQAAAARPPVK